MHIFLVVILVENLDKTSPDLRKRLWRLELRLGLAQSQSMVVTEGLARLPKCSSPCSVFAVEFGVGYWPDIPLATVSTDDLGGWLGLTTLGKCGE